MKKSNHQDKAEKIIFFCLSILILTFILGVIFVYIWNLIKFGFTPQNIFILILFLSLASLILILMLIKKFSPNSKIGEKIKAGIENLTKLIIDLITFS